VSKLLVDEISDADNTGPVTVTDGLNVSSGNVGIGTTSPSFESGTGTGLEINNSSGNGAHVKLTDAASGSGGTNGFDLYAFNTSGYIENYEAGSIVFRNGGTERLRILSTGGITFNGDTAAANALDDYEEGVFLPFTGIGSGYTGEVLENAQYTKIGRMVYINLRMKWTGTDGVGNPAIFIMPFTHATATATGTTGAIMYSGTQLRSGAALIAHMATNSNELYIYSGAGGAFSALTRAEFNGAYDLAISFCYYVA
jgi:hypothetical protein